MIKIKKQPIVTSSVDRHGDQIPLDVLKKFFEQMPDPWVMNNNHDISKPPMGIGYNKQFDKLDDDIWAIFFDVEVWDEEEFKNMGGFSISYTRNKICIGTKENGDIEILFNPMLLERSEIESLVRLTNKKIQIDAVELIQKNFEIPFVLILKFISLAFFTAFFGKMGSDTWDLLKKKIEIFAKEKDSKSLITPKCQFCFNDQMNGSNIEVIINVEVNCLDMLENTNQEILEIIEDVKRKHRGKQLKRISISPLPEKPFWEITHCIDKDNNLIK